MPWLSSSTRLALACFAAILAATGAMLVSLHFASQSSLSAQESALIQEVREDLFLSYKHRGAQGLAEAIQDRLEVDPRSNAIMALVAPSGAILAGNLAVRPELPAGASQFTTVQRVGDPAALPARIETLALEGGGELVVGQVRSGLLAQRAAERSGLLLALAISVPLALALALVLVRLIEARARAIAEVAERVGRGELGARIGGTGTRDAFDRLAAALDEAFARIELLVSELRTVTDGLAHDLRSPLTRLGAALDEARRSAENPATLAALERAGRETEGLEQILGTALQIVRLEAGIGRDRFARVDLAELVTEMAELFEPVAEDAGFALTVSAPAPVVIDGHRQLIAQALGNLIDNAIHYAQGGQRIAVAATRLPDGRAVVSVTDDGPGIPPERRADALRRFGRLDPARHQPGSGLGLSLVEATAALHGGHLELDDANPGLLARLTFGHAAAGH